MLPGMGLIVSTPFMVLLLLTVEVVTVVVAILASSQKGAHSRITVHATEQWPAADAIASS
jgi:hypothetical protein